jgi:hypothetical protein
MPIASVAWLGAGSDLMKIIQARAPSEEGGFIPVTIEPNHSRVLFDAGRRSALGELAGLIIQDEVLKTPTGIFKGVKRPLLREGVDDFVFAYVTCPTLTYKFPLDAQSDQHKPDRLIAHTTLLCFCYICYAIARYSKRSRNYTPRAINFMPGSDAWLGMDMCRSR